MIGDKINPQPHHYHTAQQVLPYLLEQYHAMPHTRFCATVGGESGSGKSVMAVCLQHLLQQMHLPTALLHLDDYFKLPPATNRKQRSVSLSWVGLQEVNMELLAHHISIYKQGVGSLTKPLIDFDNNSIGTEVLPIEGTKILLVEGTYSSVLPSDFRIFMGRNYHQTNEQRRARNRDVFDDTLEAILAIEHQIIAPHSQLAQLYIDQDYIVQHGAAK